MLFSDTVQSEPIAPAKPARMKAEGSDTTSSGSRAPGTPVSQAERFAIRA
ncbi:hypothetical protein ASZ90_014186 [hydrocarbon metagenome]|uniref:Uncharacterized protein n=1 Tax=hydrocarbon metagenome TaxID=938273 RepID=A0A0W8F5H5_9ZZZZ